MRGPGSASPAVAAVVVTFNSGETLDGCLGSLARHARVPLEIVVVDNASHDNSLEVAATHGDEVRLIANATNLGFARACNQALRATTAPRVLFLNPDATVTPGALDTLARRLDADPDVGAVGPLTLDPDGTIQVSTGPDLTLAGEWSQRRLVRGVRSRRAIAMRHARGRYSREHEPDWVSGSCLMARRQALDLVGGFDEAFFLYEEDADLCRRLRDAGWRVVFTPEATVCHQVGRSMAHTPRRARLEYHRSHLRYYKKHNGPMALAVLRLMLLARAAVDLARSVGSGDEERSGEATRLGRLALGRL